MRIIQSLLGVLFMLSVNTGLTQATPSESYSSKSNPLMQFAFENRFLHSIGLFAILENRCNRYVHLWEIPECARASKQIVQALDFHLDVQGEQNSADWNRQNFLFIAFKQETIGWLNNSSLTKNLEYIDHHFYQTAILGVSSFNLWNLLINATGKNELQALSMASTLFQDTTYGQTHVEYLRREKKPRTAVFAKNIELLSSIIDHMNTVRDNHQDLFNKMVFPQHILETLSPSPYHFYVPQYLAHKLKSHGFSEKMSRITPLILTLSYEFGTIEGEKHYIMNDPINLNAQHFEWKIRDIMTGYIGAREGVNLKQHLKLQQIDNLFKRSTKEAINQLMQ